MMKRLFTLMALTISMMAWSGCGNFGGDVVGAECRGDADCAPGSSCQQGDNYPYGMCTVGCDRHDDCPLNTACVDRSGGICMPTCMSSSDCREDYRCNDVRNKSGGGRSDVCEGD